MEGLQAAAAGLLEMKKNVDRIEQEIRTMKAQKENFEDPGSDIMDQSEEPLDGIKHLVCNNRLPTKTSAILIVIGIPFRIISGNGQCRSRPTQHRQQQEAVTSERDENKLDEGALL